MFGVRCALVHTDMAKSNYTCQTSAFEFLYEIRHSTRHPHIFATTVRKMYDGT